MGLTTLPTKADGSIGRVKNTLPDSDPSPNLDYYETASEHEAIKTALIDVCNEVGKHDGSTAGSLVARVGALEAVPAGFGYLLLTGTSSLPAANTIVELALSAAASLTLPVPAAGRLFIFRKTSGDSAKTVTLLPHASETVDGLSTRVLPGSDQPIDALTYRRPAMVWLAWSDGTNWLTTPMGGEIRHFMGGSGAPDDTVHTWAPTGGDYFPGSTYYDGSTTPGRLYLSCGLTLGQNRWHRMDGVDVLSVGSGSTTLPNKDRFVFVDTTSGVATLTLPSPGGANAGRQFAITRTNASGTNKITLARAGSEKINGTAANLDLAGSASAAIGRWHAVSDGTDWWVF